MSFFVLAWSFPDLSSLNLTACGEPLRFKNLRLYLPEKDYFLAPVRSNQEVSIAPFKLMNEFYCVNSTGQILSSQKFVFFTENPSDRDYILIVLPYGYIVSGTPSEGDVIVAVAGVPGEGESYWKASCEKLFLSSFTWKSGGSYVLKDPWNKLRNYSSRFRNRILLFRVDDFVELDTKVLSDFSRSTGGVESFLIKDESTLWNLPISFVENGGSFLMVGLPAFIRVYDMFFLRFPVFDSREIYSLFATALKYGFSFYRGDLPDVIRKFCGDASRDSDFLKDAFEGTGVKIGGKTCDLTSLIPVVYKEPFSSLPESSESVNVIFPSIRADSLLEALKVKTSESTSGKLSRMYLLVDPLPWELPVIATLNGLKSGMTVYEGDRWFPVYVSYGGIVLGSFVSPVPGGFKGLRVSGYRGGFTGGVNVASDGSMVSSRYRLVFKDSLKGFYYDSGSENISLLSAPVELYLERSTGIRKIKIKGNYSDVGAVFGKWADYDGALVITLYDAIDAVLFESSLKVKKGEKLSLRFPFDRELFKGSYVKVFSSFGEGFFQKSQPAVGVCPGLLLVKTSSFDVIFASSQSFLFNFAKDGLTLTFSRPFRFFVGVFPADEKYSFARGLSLLAQLFYKPEAVYVKLPKWLVHKVRDGATLFRVEPSWVVLSQSLNLDKDSSAVNLKLFNPSDSSVEVKFFSDFYELKGARASGVVLSPHSYSEVRLLLVAADGPSGASDLSEDSSKGKP